MARKEVLFHATSKQIQTNPENSWENGDLTDLIASIRSFGIIEPLAIMGPMEDGNYQLLSGERRYKSIKRIEEEDGVQISIPCYLKSDGTLSKEMQRIYINSANLESREPDMRTKNAHRAAIMEDLLKIQESEHFSDRSIAAKASELFKCTPTYARFWKLVFTNGTDSLKDLLKDNGVSAKNASKISILTPGQQEAVVDRIRETNNADEAHDLAQGRSSASTASVSEIIEDVKKEFPTADTEKPEKVVKGKSDLKLSEQDLELLDIDPEDINVEELIGEGYDQESDYGYSSSPSYREPKSVDTAAAAVIEWCNAIIKKTDPTEEEWEAIEACKEVADVFA